MVALTSRRAPDAKAAFGPTDEHIWVANSTNGYDAAANQYPRAQVQQRVPAAIVCSSDLQPVAAGGGQIQPLLLDLTKQQRLTFSRSTLLLIMHHPPGPACR